MKKIKISIVVLFIAAMLQSCVIGKNQVGNRATWVNRTIERAHIKPTESALLVIDTYNIPFSTYQYDRNFIKNFYPAYLKNKGVTTNIYVKDYTKDNADKELASFLTTINAGHIIYITPNSINEMGNTNAPLGLSTNLYGVNVIDKQANLSVWKGNISTNNASGIFQALEKDGLIVESKKLTSK